MIFLTLQGNSEVPSPIGERYTLYLFVVELGISLVLSI
jgi:hypothetical protein